MATTSSRYIKVSRRFNIVVLVLFIGLSLLGAPLAFFIGGDALGAPNLNIMTKALGYMIAFEFVWLPLLLGFGLIVIRRHDNISLWVTAILTPLLVCGIFCWYEPIIKMISK